MDDTDGGIVIVVRDVQYSNADSLMDVMLGGIVIVVSFEHSLKAHIPMVEMLSAMVTASTSLYGGPNKSYASPV